MLLCNAIQIKFSEWANYPKKKETIFIKILIFLGIYKKKEYLFISVKSLTLLYVGCSLIVN